MVVSYGEDDARSLFGLTNTLVVFGGGKDVHFYRELSDLLGTTRVRRTSYSYRSTGWSRSTHGETVPVLRGEEIRHLPPGRALVVAENAPPLIARLTRCLTGPRGLQLLAAQAAARSRVTAARAGDPPRAECTGAAHHSVRPAGPAPAKRSAR
jgi:type IV secretion system protein VirD4